MERERRRLLCRRIRRARELDGGRGKTPTAKVGGDSHRQRFAGEAVKRRRDSSEKKRGVSGGEINSASSQFGKEPMLIPGISLECEVLERKGLAEGSNF